MSSTKGHSHRPHGITADKLRSGRYELQLSNFLVDTPMLVPKKKAWPATKKGRRATDTSPAELSITMPREAIVISDRSSSEMTHDGSDADSESEKNVTPPSKKVSKNAGIMKVTKQDKCMKDSTVPCLKKTKQVVFDDTDTGFLADSSEPELPLKSCLKTKGKKESRKNVHPSDASAEKSSAAETTEASSTDADSAKAVVQLSDEDSNVGPATTTDDENKSDATTGASGNWSPSEDAAILAMKDGGETWAAIGQAIGRGKKETQKRWKELCSLLKQQADSDAAEAGSLTTDNMTVTSVLDTENDADNEMTDGAAGKKGKGKVGKGGKKPSSPPVKKNKKSPAAETATLVNISSDSDDEAGGSTSDNAVDSEAEVYTRMYSSMYGRNDGAAELEPDSDFSALECNVLGVIDTKHKVNHWLEVQADFFNMTGRMVPLGVLRRKLEGGPQMAAIVEADEE